jgi:hypothetical protein
MSRPFVSRCLPANSTVMLYKETVNECCAQYQPPYQASSFKAISVGTLRLRKYLQYFARLDIGRTLINMGRQANETSDQRNCIDICPMTNLFHLNPCKKSSTKPSIQHINPKSRHGIEPHEPKKVAGYHKYHAPQDLEI